LFYYCCIATHNTRFLPNLNLLHYLNCAFVTEKMAPKKLLPILYLTSVCSLSLVLQIYPHLCTGSSCKHYTP
jgi:hypothetical protein